MSRRLAAQQRFWPSFYHRLGLVPVPVLDEARTGTSARPPPRHSSTPCPYVGTYIAGRDLDSLRREQAEQRFPLHVALDLLAPIADALNYLHTQDPPIVHRDIKPANLILPRETAPAMLVNFGLAKQYLSDGTTVLIRRGTPSYAAPEQYTGGTTPRTDIYALGATLYTFVTGIVLPDAISRVIKYEGVDPLKPAHLLTPALPGVVSRAIERAMSVNPAQRFATISEFWWALTAR